MALLSPLDLNTGPVAGTEWPQPHWGYRAATAPRPRKPCLCPLVICQTAEWPLYKPYLCSRGNNAARIV